MSYGEKSGVVLNAPPAVPEPPYPPYQAQPPYQYQAEPSYQAQGSDYQSQAPPPPPVFKTKFACMSMNMTDRLRFISFSKADVETVRTAIRRSWPRGIQEERNYHGAHEFKLRGNPWSGQGSEAVPSRMLMCSVLAALYNVGWVMRASTDISKKQLDKDSCLFRYQQPVPPPCSWFAISFNRGDRLRLIGAPEELIQPFKQMLGPLLQNEGWKERGAYEFKCKGWPWFAAGAEAVSTRIMLLRMLEILENHGFSLYASIDQNTGPGGDSRVSETDTWYCCRQLGWVPGAPVFH